MLYSAIIRDKRTRKAQFLIGQNYNSKKELIEDVRFHGYSVNENTVKESRLFKYIVDNHLDWSTESLPEELDVEIEYPDFKYEDKSKILWDHIMLVYPDAILYREYKHGELLFYPNKETADKEDDDYLYNCSIDAYGRINIYKEFDCY